VARRFVFLEIRDPEINALFGWLRESAMGAPSRHNVHITIRGPYSAEVPESQLKRIQEALNADPIVFDGVGMFSAGTRYVVYVKVQHPKLRQVWWKPDFPVEVYGFNPHITLYEGGDKHRAEAVLHFLQHETLRVLTWDFEVTARVSDHRDLFGDAPRLAESFLGLINKGLVRPDIISRLERTLRASSHAA
jgi:2'-5' RNA ligase